MEDKYNGLADALDEVLAEYGINNADINIEINIDELESGKQENIDITIHMHRPYYGK